MAKQVSTVEVPKEKAVNTAAQIANILKAKGEAATRLNAVYSLGFAASKSTEDTITAVRKACGATEKQLKDNTPFKPVLATFRQVRLMFKASVFAERAGYANSGNGIAQAIDKLCALNSKATNKDKTLAKRTAKEDTHEAAGRDRWREMIRKAQLISPEVKGGANKDKAKVDDGKGSRKSKGKPEVSKPAMPSNVVEFPAAKVKTVDAIARVVLNVASHLDDMEKQSSAALTGEIGSIVRQWIVETRAIVARINEASARDDKTASEKAQAKAQAKVEKAKADELARVVMKQG